MIDQEWGLLLRLHLKCSSTDKCLRRQGLPLLRMAMPTLLEVDLRPHRRNHQEPEWALDHHHHHRNVLVRQS
jgi:hypothetical protein